MFRARKHARGRSRFRAFAVTFAFTACGGAQHASSTRTCPGTVTIASQDEASAIATCTSFARLTIRTGMAIDLAPLAKIERVDQLVIGPTLALDHVALPALREVGDITIQSNASVRGVFLPQLTVARNVTIAGNAQVTTVSLPRLTRVASNLRIEENGSLEVVDLSQLSTVESLQVVNNPVLATLEMPTTLDTHIRVIEGNRALGELQTPGTTSGGGDHE